MVAIDLWNLSKYSFPFKGTHVSLAISSNGKKLGTLDKDGVLRVWNLITERWEYNLCVPRQRHKQHHSRIS